MAADKNRVLIIEDEPLIMMMLEDMLEDLGCLVVGTSSHLTDGTQKAASLDIDFAILDLNLAGERSTPIAEVLNRRHIAFLVASGEEGVGSSPEFQRAIVLGKPFSQLALGEAIARLHQRPAASST